MDRIRGIYNWSFEITAEQSDHEKNLIDCPVSGAFFSEIDFQIIEIIR